MKKLKILIQDGIINENGDNPFGPHIIPQVGSRIIYKTFRKNKTDDPILDIHLRVEWIEYITEEGWNGTHECSVNVHCSRIKVVKISPSDVFNEK